MQDILIFTLSFDEHSNVICERLLNENIDILRIDADKLVEDTPKVSFIPGEGILVNGKIINPHKTSILYRRLTHIPINSNFQDKDEKLAIEQWNSFNKGIASILDDSFWVSHPHFIQRASNKPFQLQVAKSLGLKIPKTIITNDIKNIMQNIPPSSICVKTLEQSFWSIENGVQGIYTNRVSSDLLTDDNVKPIPAIWQEYIEKLYEVRVTVVGNKLFTCKIDNQVSSKAKVDWRRYDFKNVPHLSHSLPDEIEVKILELMKVFSLRYAAIDFAVDMNGNYIFLEINPTGQWMWIEELTGLLITEELCNLLKAGKL
ncbi:hypothetical protein [Anabaena sp. PCC 7108]|uniref:hypothetical protein n=1 Tax=Anabaena sp. PCC 7108 TaxID=163908 RepID=UPI000347611F|nr:hypothetical protein [Anabaena sp. PCC 7108]